MRLRVDLAYDGAPFYGFASQPDVPSVQGELEEGLAKLLGQDIDTTGAGRTDRGVHATAQVAHLDLDATISTAARNLGEQAADGTYPDLRRRLQRITHDAVTIWSVRAVPDDFDARFSAVRRRYRYRIADTELLHPLDRHVVWHVDSPLVVGAMRAGARHLIGPHDFASFCRRSDARTTERRIASLTVARVGDGYIHVALAGPAFCHQQVRSIVGCLVEVGAGREGPDWIADVLEARDRSVAARVAPARGLVLEGVSYGRRWPAAPPPMVRGRLSPPGAVGTLFGRPVSGPRPMVSSVEPPAERSDVGQHDDDR